MIEAGNTIVLIPALKKNVAFTDDLVKKLAGVALIQRAIDRALMIAGYKNRVLVVTDSEEIELIAERNKVCVYRDASLKWNESGINKSLFSCNVSRISNFCCN